MSLKSSISTITNSLSNEIYNNLELLVNTNSFTANLDGNIKVANMLIDMAKEHDIKLDMVYSSKKQRPHLMFGKDLKKDYCAIIGHFDTVHPPKSGFDTMIYKDDFIIGPGTNDMKAGVIIALYSLVVLKKLYPNKDIPIKLLFNSDEEIGSLDSRELIENEFKEARAGFVFEPGRIKDFSIVTSRKGISSLDIKLIGKPAHSGSAPWDGANAIIGATKLIKKLEKLNNYEKGLIVGCNEIKGGIARNVVAPICEIGVDVRYETSAQRKKLIKKIENILTSYRQTGIKVEYSLLNKRPPFVSSEENQQLFKKYQEASSQYGVECNQASAGGVSDANFLSAMSIPTLDGLGAFGDYCHTKKEFILKESLMKKIEIFTYFFEKYMH